VQAAKKALSARIRGMRGAGLHKTMAPRPENCLLLQIEVVRQPFRDRETMPTLQTCEPINANARLYNPAAGGYVTLQGLAPMVEDEEEFVVREAGTGEDVTGSILRQIILKRAKHG